MFTCRDCKRTDLALDNMKKEPYLQANNRGICTCCANKYEVVRQLIKSADKNPDNYLTCEDCDRIFKKQQGGRYPKLRVNCPFCKSEEISRY